MKSSIVAIAATCSALAFSPAWAAKSCDELKSEIEAKLQGHGVKSYTLDVVVSDASGDGKVVGTCETGKKKILYKKG
ncbi:DUF1161 domain-containing protein [Viridibacterium curvum]|uniref:DUF1161 domain-containing protein n=1 Tax=Viridibacterium curvum TaxID=1101404 RepID=A0ABP9QAJ9_9RHOO